MALDGLYAHMYRQQEEGGDCDEKNNPSSLIRLAKMMKPYMKYLYFVFFLRFGF